MNNILGFYAPDQENGYLSNWYFCSFKYGRYTYSSAEQFMMAQKAALFRDYDIFFKIIHTDDQSKIKKLGKQVANYNDDVWSRLRGPMMRRGLRAKFQQNPELMEKLLATGNMVLAECSPRDKIWGIGLAVDDARIQDPLKWRGQNLLGKVLMEVRSDLRSWATASNGKVEYIDAMDMPANEIWSMPFQAVCKLPRIREAKKAFTQLNELNLLVRKTGSELEQALAASISDDIKGAQRVRRYQDIPYNRLIAFLERFVV